MSSSRQSGVRSMRARKVPQRMSRRHLMATDCRCTCNARAVASDAAALSADGHRFENRVEHLGTRVTLGLVDDVDSAGIRKPHALIESVGTRPATQLKTS